MTIDAEMSAERVARFAIDTTWSDVPETIRARTRLVLADTLGVMIAGSSATASRIVRQTVETPGTDRLGDHQAMVWAADGSALDFDDGHVAGGGIHPSSTLVAALLASALDLSISGDRFLASQLVGYEIAVRAGALLYPRLATDRYHCAGTAATIGAAAGVSRLLSDDHGVVRRAIEIASAYAPMAGFQLPMVKESIGWGGATAVMSARLAGHGFNQMDPQRPRTATRPRSFGHPTVFDEPAAQHSDFVQSLGRTYEIANGYLKPYACCRLIHTTLDAVTAILQEHGVDRSDVVRVLVETHGAAAELTLQDPGSVEDAQYSIPFVLGSFLVRGASGAMDLTDDLLDDEDVLAAARRVTVVHDREQDQLYPDFYPAAVKVTTASGRVFGLMRKEPRGDRTHPLSVEEVRAKFIFNTRNLPDADSQALWSMCANFERHEVGEMREILLGP